MCTEGVAPDEIGRISDRRNHASRGQRAAVPRTLLLVDRTSLHVRAGHSGRARFCLLLKGATRAQSAVIPPLQVQGRRQR
jgi:hypothetical protein